MQPPASTDDDNHSPHPPSDNDDHPPSLPPSSDGNDDNDDTTTPWLSTMWPTPWQWQQWPSALSMTRPYHLLQFHFLFALWLLCAQLHWHLFPFLCSYAHGRYALNGRTRTIRVTWPWTFPRHVPPDRLLVRFPFPSHVTLTVLVCVMPTRLDLLFVMLTISRLCFLLIFGCDDSS